MSHTAEREPVNAMTVDVEDYFQVSAFEGQISRDHWPQLESRVCANTDRLLEIFDDAGVVGTFFVLGWVADRFPSLVRRIADAGHELASHSHWHRLVYTMTPQEFRDDVRQSKRVLEDASGRRIAGFRAPSYSITRQSLWALEILAEEGFTYDASVFPIYHDRYGIPDAPRHPYRVSLESGELWELPGSTVRYAGQNLPIGGGGYFRILPYAFTRHGIRRVNVEERQPVMFYLHPWEIDPDQPRIQASRVSRFRHYRNLSKTERRLRRLLADFRFGTAASMLARTAAAQHRATIPAA